METLELQNKFDDLTIVTIYILDLVSAMVKVDVTTNGIENSITVKYSAFKQKQKLESWLLNQFEEKEKNEVIESIEKYFI